MKFLNHIHFLQLIKIYKILKYVIKFVNIDILKHVIAHFCLYFAEADVKNYRSEMFYFWKLVATDACNLSLQQIILVNDLVNNQNKSNIFFKVDHLNELLNLELKKLFWSYRNSTFEIKNLFKWSILTINYIVFFKKKFECVFDEFIKNSHTIKFSIADIQTLADLIAHDSIKQQHVQAAK